jgi:hypothetical protein
MTIATRIEKKDFWDVRDLAAIATEKYNIVTDETSAADAKEDARSVLKILGDALVSFDRLRSFPLTEEQYKVHYEAVFHDDSHQETEPFVFGEDIADLWEELGDYVHVTLVHDSYLEEYVEDIAQDFGWLSDETPDFIKNAINWADVADSMKLNGEGGKLELDGETYWIGIA